jgi:hypothetical protein
MCTRRLTKNYTCTEELLCFNLEAKTKHQSNSKDVLVKRAVCVYIYIYICICMCVHDLPPPKKTRPHARMHTHTQSFVIVISYLDTVIQTYLYV